MTDAAREVEGKRLRGLVIQRAREIDGIPSHMSHGGSYEAHALALADIVASERASARREALNEALVLVVSLRVLALGQDDLITADALKILDERIRALASPGEGEKDG